MNVYMHTCYTYTQTYMYDICVCTHAARGCHVCFWNPCNDSGNSSQQGREWQASLKNQSSLQIRKPYFGTHCDSHEEQGILSVHVEAAKNVVV